MTKAVGGTHPFAQEKRLAESLPQGIFVVNQQQQVQWWNQVANDLLDLEKFGDQPDITNVIPGEKFKSFLQNKKQTAIEFISPLNKNRHLSVDRRPYNDGQSLMIIQDITHTHRLENMRQDFIANVSHELRTPLTVFHGYLEILMDLETIEKKQLNTILEQMSGQSTRMERLVKDLLLLSRLESAEPDLEKHHQVDVASLVTNISEDAKSLSGKQQHVFTLDLDHQRMLKGQADELHSAFSNIIFNAVRYTPAGGSIAIRWYGDDNGQHFEVKDSGIGIAAKHIDRITQRFYRVDKARSREKGGTGLGLAIVKHVLLRHHGELFIESTPNEGSTFRCSFS